VSARRDKASRPTITQFTVVLALGAAGALTLPACAPKKSPTMEPISVTEAKTEDQASAASANMDELSQLLADLAPKANNLPGRTAEAHRSAMHDVFDNLTRLLPILAGPEAGGGFRQQLRSVEAARDRLAPDAGDINAEPAIGSGVRAAAAAFNDIAQDDDTFAGPDIAANLKKLQTTVDEFDAVGGVGRPYVAADSMKLMAQIAQQMADRIRGDGGAISSTSDAAPPAPAAATAEPAATSEPAAAPADAAPATTEPAAAPIEPKPAEQNSDGGPTPPAVAEPAPAPAPAEPAPAAEPNK
jgi:hypothetical protein